MKKLLIYIILTIMLSYSAFAAICGNNIIESPEECDGGNTVGGDGCDAFCKLEPDCSSGTCQTVCGDGIKLPGDSQECDDGNTVNGDGCSSTCQIETGYICTDTQTTLPSTLTLPVVSRDFISLPKTGYSRHPDFEVFRGDKTSGNLTKGQLVSGLPVLSGNCTSSSVVPADCPYGQQMTTDANFAQWYRNTAGVNIQKVNSITLTKQVDNTYYYSNSAYFPVDNFGWVSSGAESTYFTSGANRNFGFTNEIKHWFTYKGGEVLKFTGDDDVWVYINNKLAVDVGGVHPPDSKTVTLNAAMATKLGLVVGQVYELDFFHAERHTIMSNFELTIGGFTSAKSTCLEITKNLTESIINISDRTISFNIGSFPQYTYDLKNMINNWNQTICPADQLEFNLSDSFNYSISGPDASKIITIKPVNWNISQLEKIEVTASCKNLGTVVVSETVRTGSADIVLITDFSGSMKKNLLFNDEQGNGQSSCPIVYSESTPRLSALARCIDTDFVTKIMEVEGNRIWPVYFKQDQITSYTGDPTNPGSVIAAVTPNSQAAGETCLSCAVNAGYNIFNSNNIPTRKKYVVMMTDGWPTHCANSACTGTGTIPQPAPKCDGYCDFQGNCGATNNAECTSNTCDQPVANTVFSTNRIVTDFGAKFYTIGFGVVDSCALTQTLLTGIAASSPGGYFASRLPDKLKEFYLKIAEDIITETTTYTNQVTKYKIRDVANLTIVYTAPVSTVDLQSTTITFDETAIPGYIYNLSNMLSASSKLYCEKMDYTVTNGASLVNFTYIGPTGNNGTLIIAPNFGWLIDREENFIIKATCTGYNGVLISDTAPLRVIFDNRFSPSCGNAIVELPEKCDNGPTNGASYCSTSCEWADIGLEEKYITFNYTSFPGHKYNLTDMINPSAFKFCTNPKYEVLTSPVNFTVSGPVGPDKTITLAPTYGTPWFVATTETLRINVSCTEEVSIFSPDVETTYYHYFEDIARLNVIYKNEDLPPTQVTCKLLSDYYLAKGAAPESLLITDIFGNIPPGSEYAITQSASPSGKLIVNLIGGPPATSINFKATAKSDLTTINVVMDPTSDAIASKTCTIKTWSMYTNCEQSACTGLTTHADLDAAGCLDGEIPVYTPFTPKSIKTLFGTNLLFGFSSTIDPKYVMTPSSGDQTTISRFSNITDIPLGYKGIVKINGNFNGGNFIPFCYSLRRINFKIGENSYDPNTTLLITSTKSISGFYELDGETFSRGPFMFIVKAWLRK